ncbi:MAG: ribonuclease P protein component [Planctomycetota bacterium]
MNPQPREHDATFGKQHRVRRKPEFDAAFAENRSRADARLVVYLREQEAGAAGVTRIGLVVGKRIGNSPQRNRVKRLLREAFRQVRTQLPAGLDVVVLPRPDATAGYTVQALQDSLVKLVRLPVPESRPPRPPRKRGKK